MIRGFADLEQVDSVINKLAIERRVQYGAEKMLDVGFHAPVTLIDAHLATFSTGHREASRWIRGKRAGAGERTDHRPARSCKRADQDARSAAGAPTRRSVVLLSPPPNRWADEAQVHHNDLVDDHSLD